MMEKLCLSKNARTFSVCPENFTGGKGVGGSATHGTGESPARELGIGWKISPSVIIPAGQRFTLADIRGSGSIKHIWITDDAPAGRLLVLRMYWDGSDKPSVEVPLSDFFAGANYPEYRQLSSLAVCINPKRGLNCYFEMPYRKGFRIELENLANRGITVYYQIDCEEKDVPDDALYFHAQFRRSNPVAGGIHTLLDGVSGHGHYVGTYLYWGVNNNGWWGEGEMKFYIDGDKDFPTVCGTGTEDYFCGAYNFDVDGRYAEFTTPYSGMYKVDRTDGIYLSNRRFNLYRWHINDPIYFSEDLRVTVQALGWRSEGRYLPLKDDISSVAYWYSDRTDDTYPTFPEKNELEII